MIVGSVQFKAPIYVSPPPDRITDESENLCCASHPLIISDMTTSNICTVLCWCVSFRNALVKILSNFTISEIQYIAVCLQLRDDLTMSLCCVGWCKCRLNFKKEVLHLMQIWCASNIHWSWREEIRFCCVCDSFIHYP